MRQISSDFPGHQEVHNLVFFATGQACLTTNSGVDIAQYRTNYNSNKQYFIPVLHQAILPSYRFNCSGKITAWRVDVYLQSEYSLHFQVWRPLPTKNGSRHYSLVDENIVTSTRPLNKVIQAAPSTAEQVRVNSGDMVGIYVQGSQAGRGIPLLTSFGSEELWYKDTEGDVPVTGNCFTFNTTTVFDTCTDAVPIILVSVDTTDTKLGIVIIMCMLKHY